MEHSHGGSICEDVCEPQRRVVKYIDLFCGLGAFHTAFNRQNLIDQFKRYECVFACDIDANVRKIYEENYGLCPHGDINTLDIHSMPEFEILCAGFPCQPFSIAGKKEGFDDEVKGNLFYRILEIVDVRKPKTLILENVKNLHTIHGGHTFKTIMTELEKRNYKVNYKIIDSRHYGSPQSRQRIYIVCDQETPYKFCEMKKPIVPVSSIIDESVEEFLEHEQKYDIRPNKNAKGMIKSILINKKSGKGGRQGERVYNIDMCGPTICASSGGPGAKTGLYEVNGRLRTLSVKETLQMFGFETTYKYATLANPKHMLFYLGNSIVVNVLEELVKYL